MRSLRGFPAVILGAVAASAIWIIVVLSISTTPQEAKQRRGAPDLPPPTVALEKKVLQQVSWHPCNRAERSVTVRAIPAPSGRRSVVTALARPGTKVQTGLVLARVAGEPQVAVVGDGVLYRDLAAGATGPDVRLLTGAMARAGWVPAASTRLEASDIATWHRRTGLAPAATIGWSNLVVVPPQAVVGAALVGIGEPVKANQALLTATARARTFTCEVIDPVPSLDPAAVRFEVSGTLTPVAHLTVRPRDDQSPGVIEVTPGRRGVGGEAQLGIVSGGTPKPVLAAPLSALRTDTDGSTMVEVVDGEQSRTVQVEVGASSQGWVEVAGADLAPGMTLRLFGPDEAGGPVDGAG